MSKQKLFYKGKEVEVLSSNKRADFTYFVFLHEGTKMYAVISDNPEIAEVVNTKDVEVKSNDNTK